MADNYQLPTYHLEMIARVAGEVDAAHVAILMDHDGWRDMAVPNPLRTALVKLNKALQGYRDG